MSAFLDGWRAGMERAAEIADRLGGDRYDPTVKERANPREAEGRTQMTIEAQHLRARSIAKIIRSEIEEGPR